MDLSTPETRRAYQQSVLQDAIATGADFVQMVQAQAKAQAEANPAAPLSAAVADYDRATRSIRRSIMLSQKLDQPAHHRTAARRQIIRAVEDNIHRHAEPGDEAETLQAELLDRLDRPDLEEDIDSRPVEQIVTDIVRDLGLAAIPGLNDPWKRRTPADLATLHARAAVAPAPASAMAARDPARHAVPPLRPWPHQSPTTPHPSG